MNLTQISDWAQIAMRQLSDFAPSLRGAVYLYWCSNMSVEATYSLAILLNKTPVLYRQMTRCLVEQVVGDNDRTGESHDLGCTPQHPASSIAIGGAPLPD